MKLLNAMYNTKDGVRIRNSVVHSIQSILSNKNVLMYGLVSPYLKSNVSSNDVQYIDYKDCNLDKRLPFADKKFDVIILSHLIEFTPYFREFIKDTLRVLKDDGTLVMIVANKGFQRMKCRSTSEIMSFILRCNLLKIKEIVGVSCCLKIWPYEFHWRVSRYNYFLLPLMPFWADVTVVKLKKTELEVVSTFVEDYGVVNV